MREKLIYLMTDSKCPTFFLDNAQVLALADYLIKNGVTIPVICKNCAHSDYYEGKLICYKYTEYMVDEIRFLEVAPDGFCDDGKWKEDE